MGTGAEIITNLSLLGMAVLGLLSMVPVDLSKRAKGEVRGAMVALYYPVLGLGLFALYEAGIQAQIPPETVPIRIDLAFVHPLVGFIVLMGICRWLLWARARGEGGSATSGNIEQPTSNSERPRKAKAGTGAQLVGVIVSLVVCFGWFCSMWF